MKFMVFVMLGKPEEYEQGAMPTPEGLSEMTTYNESLAAAGVIVDGQGFHPTAKGARITFSGGTPTVTDGPFTETKEVIGGYWIWQVESKEEAIEWARKAPFADDDSLVLRQIFDMADFAIEPGSELAGRLDRLSKDVMSGHGAS